MEGPVRELLTLGLSVVSNRLLILRLAHKEMSIVEDVGGVIVDGL